MGSDLGCWGIRASYDGSGQKRVSHLVRMMRCWSPHTVLFQNGKAWVYHITGLLECRMIFLKCRKAFLVFM